MKNITALLVVITLSFFIFSCSKQGDSNQAHILFDASKFHQTYLKAPNTSSNDWFGYSVAISGDTIAVGAHQESSDTTDIINGSDLSATNDNLANSGAVYVFVRTDGEWALQAYLKAPNSSENDHFGYSVAISGDTVAVGTVGEDSDTTAIINGSDLTSTNDLGESNGAVYVFTRTGSAWSHQAYLKAPNNDNGMAFGYTVAVAGDTIAVGAPTETSTTTAIINGSDLSATNTDGSNNGAVYVFTRTGSAWSHQAYLKAPNNSLSDQFGHSVAISGDTIAAGSYNECSTTTEIINGSELSGTDDLGNYNGAVYVFTRTGSTWSHQAYLKASNNTNYDYFGNPLSISGNTIAAGAPGEDSGTTSIINGSDLSATNNDGSSNGAVYVFTRTGSNWAHQAYLKAPNGSDSDLFGFSVSISGDFIAVGASLEDSTTNETIIGSDLSETNDIGENNGAVYVFARTNAAWSHLAYLKAPNGSSGDQFGYSVSVSGNTVAVGSPYEDSSTTTIISGVDLSATNNDGFNNGAAYVFTYDR